MTKFDELLTQLNDALDRFDKLAYRELLLSANLSILTEDERVIVEKWMIRERAMIEIEKQKSNLSSILEEQTLIFERATEDDPDFYYPPQREIAYTQGVDDYLIVIEHIQELRTLTYDEFTCKYFEHK